MSRYVVKVKRGIAVLLVFVLSIAMSGVQSSYADQKVKLSRTKLTLKVGEKKTLKLYYAKNVTWKSKDSKIATVSKKGVVTAKKKGTTKITATVKKKKYSCKVIVLAKETVNQTPKPTGEPALKVPEPQVIWEVGEKSGTEEDFNRYFQIDMRDYTKAGEGTGLGTIEDIHYTSKVVGGEREAYVYLPAGYSAEKEYPVLYMIHGIGCTRDQWYSMSLNNILSNMIASGEVVPFIAVLPSVIPKDGVNKNTLSAENIKAYTDFEQEFLQDLEPYIKAHYSISAKAEDTGVCGLSMGGMEALSLGFSIREHFNYIGSFSAAPSLDQSVLNVNGWSFAPKVVLVCTGTNDSTVGENPYNYHMTLLQNGVEHIWYLYPKGTHSDPVWKNGLVNFLKRSFR